MATANPKYQDIVYCPYVQSYDHNYSDFLSKCLFTVVTLHLLIIALNYKLFEYSPLNFHYLITYSDITILILLKINN